MVPSKGTFVRIHRLIFTIEGTLAFDSIQIIIMLLGADRTDVEGNLGLRDLRGASPGRAIKFIHQIKIGSAENNLKNMFEKIPTFVLYFK